MRFDRHTSMDTSIYIYIYVYIYKLSFIWLPPNISSLLSFVYSAILFFSVVIRWLALFMHVYETKPERQICFIIFIHFLCIAFDSFLSLQLAKENRLWINIAFLFAAISMFFSPLLSRWLFISAAMEDFKWTDWDESRSLSSFVEAECKQRSMCAHSSVHMFLLMSWIHWTIQKKLISFLSMVINVSEHIQMHRIWIEQNYYEYCSWMMLMFKQMV